MQRFKVDLQSAISGRLLIAQLFSAGGTMTRESQIIVVPAINRWATVFRPLRGLRNPGFQAGAIT